MNKSECNTEAPKFARVELGEILHKKKSKGVTAKRLKELAKKDGDIKLLSTGNFDGWTTEELAETFEVGEVITIPTGGTANLKYHNGKFINSLNHVFETNVNTKYVYHFMKNENKLIQEHFRGSSVQHPDMDAIYNINIPIPLKPLKSIQSNPAKSPNYTKTESLANLSSSGENRQLSNEELPRGDYNA